MALSCNPELLIADEPTTALDVTVQAQILEELNRLRVKEDVALMIITHNLGIVARYADSVKILYGGKIVEEGNPTDIFERPCHPYTIGLVKAVPRLDLPRSHALYAIPGEPPDMSVVPENTCAFADRCRYVKDDCRRGRPSLAFVAPGHFCACFHREDTAAERAELMAIGSLHA
jgi:oligopeptide/dipeptide ABC transporter ATP-binding protein